MLVEMEIDYGLTHEKCEECDGVGQKPCGDCDGEGMVSCEYDCEHDCPDCGGYGKVDCFDCCGTGNAAAAFVLRRRVWESITENQRSIAMRLFPSMTPGFPAVDRSGVWLKGRFSEIEKREILAAGFKLDEQGYCVRCAPEITSNDLTLLRKAVAGRRSSSRQGKLKVV